MFYLAILEMPKIPGEIFFVNQRMSTHPRQSACCGQGTGVSEDGKRYRKGEVNNRAIRAKEGGKLTMYPKCSLT